MIHICNADHARAPKLMKRLRRWFVLALGFMIPCAHCGRGFKRSGTAEAGWWRSGNPVSLDWSCRVYHQRCYDEMCYMPAPELAERRAELRRRDHAA